LRNPVEFCSKLPAIHLPSDYVGVFKEAMSNEDINVQNQERSQNAGEGSSRSVNVALDNDGHEIDLNCAPANF